VTVRWNLRLAMAERGIFTMAELGRRMANRGNYSLTAPALHRLAGGKDGQPPKEIKLATLNAMLDALNFPATDFGVFRYEPPTDQNRAVQPLVVNSDVRPGDSRNATRVSSSGRVVRRIRPPDDGQ
jgi:putative transcriptional regulator